MPLCLVNKVKKCTFGKPADFHSSSSFSFFLFRSSFSSPGFFLPLFFLLLFLHPLHLIVCARHFLSAAAFLSHFLLFDGLQHSIFCPICFRLSPDYSTIKINILFSIHCIYFTHSKPSISFIFVIYMKKKKLSHNSTVQSIPLLPHFASVWLFILVCVYFLGASNMLWPYWHSIEVHSVKTVWFRNILVWNNLWNLKHLESNQNRNVFVIFSLGLSNSFSPICYYSFNHFAFVFFFI